MEVFWADARLALERWLRRPQNELPGRPSDEVSHWADPMCCLKQDGTIKWDVWSAYLGWE